MLDDSASDDTASLSQLTTAAALMQQPQSISLPIVRQGTPLNTSLIAGNVQLLQPMNSPQMNSPQKNSPGVLQQSAMQEAQTAGVRAQLQVYVHHLLQVPAIALYLSLHCNSCDQVDPAIDSCL